jgi:hypothetical protein
MPRSSNASVAASNAETFRGAVALGRYDRASGSERLKHRETQVVLEAGREQHVNRSQQDGHGVGETQTNDAGFRAVVAIRPVADQDEPRI